MVFGPDLNIRERARARARARFYLIHCNPFPLDKYPDNAIATF